MWQILIVIIGLLFGVYLSKKAKEEVKQGRKYFLFFERLILLLIILISIKLNLMFFIGLVLGFIICKYFKQIYFYFGILLGFFIDNLILVSLVFLFGLFYKSLNKTKNIGFDVLYLAVPFFLIQSFINTNFSILIGLSIGGVIEWARGSAW